MESCHHGVVKIEERGKRIGKKHIGAFSERDSLAAAAYTAYLLHVQANTDIYNINFICY